MALCSSLNPPAENRHELATQVTMPELVLEKDTIESGSSTPPRNMPTNLRELRKEETRNAITDGSTMTDALAPVPSVSPGTPPPDGGFWAWMAGKLTQIPFSPVSFSTSNEIKSGLGVLRCHEYMVSALPA